MPRITANSHLLYDDVGKSVLLLKNKLEEVCKELTEMISKRGKFLEMLVNHVIFAKGMFGNIKLMFPTDTKKRHHLQTNLKHLIRLLNITLYVSFLFM